MKSFYNFALFISVFFCSYSTFSLADSTGQTKHFKDLKKVSLKCYVEFIGGESSVLYHYDLPETERASFESWLLRSYTNMPGISENKKIYKIHECIEIKNKFKEKIARDLEEKLKYER